MVALSLEMRFNMRVVERGVFFSEIGSLCQYLSPGKGGRIIFWGAHMIFRVNGGRRKQNI